MTDFASKRAPFPTDNQGKIDTAIEYKNKGNEWFKEGAFKKAIVQYSTAFAFTKGLPGRKQGLEGVSQLAMNETHSSDDQITPEQDSAVTELEVVLKTNIVTCYIKLGNPVKALETVREALMMAPTAWKTLMRKAEALLLLHDPDKALLALAEASKNAPDEAAETAIQRVREKAVNMNKVDIAKQRKAFGNIFGKANAMDESA